MSINRVIISGNLTREEKWRWVPGFEGLYMVSSMGNVMSVPKVATKSNGAVAEYEGRQLSPAPNRKGYLQVVLCSDGASKTCQIHRLVAMAFVPNPDCLPCVNHINENKGDNTDRNLEWCSIEYNNAYGTRAQRIGETQSRIVQKMLADEILSEYPSTKSAAESVCGSASHISECCCGKRLSAYGFSWRYKEESECQLTA